MNMRDMLPKIWANRTGIAEGIKNKLFKKEHIEQLYEYRTSICKTCPWYSVNVKDKPYEDLPEEIKAIKSEEYISDTNKRSDIHCVNCSCKIALKARCLSCNCPLHKWEAVATDEEQHDIVRQVLNGN